MLSDEEVSATLGYTTMRGYRDKVLLQAQEQATRKEVANLLHEACSDNGRWACGHDAFVLWEKLSKGGGYNAVLCQGQCTTPSKGNGKWPG